MRVLLSSDTTTKLLLATALFLATSPVNSRAADSVDVRSSELETRQTSGSAHDMVCSDVMCIECSVQGSTARYILRTLGVHKLGWMAIGFGRNMGDSPMVVVWPSRGEDGQYNSVTLSQRKAPYEVMPTVDPNPPFVAKLSFSDTWVAIDNPQVAFTRPAPPDGFQNIIWAFSRTPPASTDVDGNFAIHQKIGRGVLNLTREFPTPAEHPPPFPPVPTPHVHHPEPPPPPPEPEEPHTEAEEPHPEAEENEDAKVEAETEDEVVETEDESGGGGSGTAGFVHGVLCTAGFLIVLPSGALVARYAKLTGSSRALRLHRRLQFGLAGVVIAGGTLAYLFMDNRDEGSVAHKVGGAGLVLLYVVQCAVGSWVHRIPEDRRTGTHGALMPGLGMSVVLLAFFQTWLGLVSAGRSTLVWSALLFAVPSLYVLGVMILQRRFGGVQEDAKGVYVALDMRTTPLDDELADGVGDEKL